MIQTVESFPVTSGIDRAGPPSSPTPVAPAFKPRTSIVRPIAPGDQRHGLPPSHVGRLPLGSLGKRLIDSLRPTSRIKASLKPIGVRLSLLRVADAIEALDVTATDPLLKTAHRLLEEEQLRVEIVRHRLQAILEG